jgi:hypothetical protein
MKRLEVVISDETDAMLDEMLASGEGSKAAFAGRLIEEGVRAALRRRDLDGKWRRGGPYNPMTIDEVKEMLSQNGALSHEPIPPDPLDALMGSIDDDPVDDIDEVIYGR